MGKLSSLREAAWEKESFLIPGRSELCGVNVFLLLWGYEKFWRARNILSLMVLYYL